MAGEFDRAIGGNRGVVLASDDWIVPRTVAGSSAAVEQAVIHGQHTGSDDIPGIRACDFGSLTSEPGTQLRVEQ